MGVKFKTTVNKLPEISETVEMLGGKRVKVGALRGDHAWLAGIHEYGCDIKAKNARFLTVPIHPDSVGKKARDFPDLFVFTAASGEKFLAKGEGDSLVFYFWLTPSVKIPERSFLRTGHDENIDDIMKRMDIAIKALLENKKTVRGVCETYGHQMATAIKKKMRDVSSPPNSDATILAKGSSNPLIDTGGLLESITYKTESE